MRRIVDRAATAFRVGGAGGLIGYLGLQVMACDCDMNLAEGSSGAVARAADPGFTTRSSEPKVAVSSTLGSTGTQE